MTLISSIQRIKTHFDNQRIDMASTKDLPAIEIEPTDNPAQVAVKLDSLFRKAIGENYNWADVLTYLALVEERTIDIGETPYRYSALEQQGLDLVRAYYASCGKNEEIH